MSMADEGGLRDHRTGFVRETTDANGDPVTPTDPEFEPYSDTIRTFEWSPNPGLEAQRGIGDADPNDHHRGPEEHQLTVVYDLQRWFIDSNGNPHDAAYDGIARTGDNRLPNTHTVVDREEKFGVAEANTVDGSSGPKDQRTYTVGRGGTIDTAAITGDPSDQQPTAIELTYEFVKIRTYKIDQPDASTELAVTSTSADDTTQNVTIEADDGTSETVTLDGTTNVATSATFDTIDAIDLDAETEGTVEVYVWDATNAVLEEQLAEISGKSEYEGVEGDLGVPAIGAGSAPGTVDQPYETFIGDTIEWGGESLAMDINSVSVEVSNDTDRTPREDSFGQRIHVGNRETELEATVIGESESHDKIMASLQNDKSDIVWTFTGGTLTFPKAPLTDPGGRTVESGQATMELDNTFEPRGVVIA